ncbi:hypothetical protein H072_5671 [Dactylellina haptotyla CBS 200.50]|uniref:Uncharacterized protein n=1 Tax=Dactylellina haptotyla (strain CBS 200.50) TaxID=1284197 RepID=S8AH45_DACHA|nr:hypothetical protein H072_5671 [Dactylellina haptotyla CBS 200.50]
MKSFAITIKIKEAFGRKFKRRGSSVSESDALKATISWPVGRGDDTSAYDSHVSRGLGFIRDPSYGDSFSTGFSPVRYSTNSFWSIGSKP